MPDSGTTVDFALTELDQVAEELIKAAGDVSVWLFFGEMGAGKTTLIKAIGRHLGVYSPMASPTFSIVNEYDTAESQTICHFDFYRLKREEEAYDIGVDEYFDSGRLCLVEWPERVPNLVPPRHFEIRLTILSETQRRLQYQRYE